MGARVHCVCVSAAGKGTAVLKYARRESMRSGVLLCWKGNKQGGLAMSDERMCEARSSDASSSPLFALRFP